MNNPCYGFDTTLTTLQSPAPVAEEADRRLRRVIQALDAGTGDTT